MFVGLLEFIFGCRCALVPHTKLTLVTQPHPTRINTPTYSHHPTRTDVHPHDTQTRITPRSIPAQHPYSTPHSRAGPPDTPPPFPSRCEAEDERLPRQQPNAAGPPAFNQPAAMEPSASNGRGRPPKSKGFSNVFAPGGGGCQVRRRGQRVGG